MRTNIELNDKLLKEAFKYSQVETKRELIEIALKEFVENHKRRDVRDLIGKIDFFRKNKNHATEYFNKILEQKIPYFITGFIYQEVLQGAKDEKQFNLLQEYLSTQRFIHPKNPVSTFQEAAAIYFRCRKKGLTIRSTLDCLIAQLAIENNLILIHNDKDFLNIHKVEPHLQLLK
jgi:predicted nucleic acid-binding protein